MAESAKPKPASPAASSFVKTYLLIYNLASLLGWFAILALTVSHVATVRDYHGVFTTVWPLLTIVQTAAIFEVIHSMLGWVRAPMLTTAMQVASRLFLVWGVNFMFPAIHSHGSFTTMMIAWSIAECVRYSYYSFHLASEVPGLISWARYNFFLVLYPAGVSSELMMVYQALPYARQLHEAYYYALIVAALVYLPGFPVLFSHMLVQRKKYYADAKQKTQKAQ